MTNARRLKVALGGGLFLALAFALLSGSAQAVDNSTRLDAGPTIEVRIGEGFDVVVAAYYEDPQNGIEALEFY